MSELTIRRVPEIGMVVMRGDLDELAKAAGIGVPAQRRITAGANGERLMWMSPDELMLTCADGPQRATALGTALDGAFATVADMSDARAVFELSGPDVSGALAKLMPVDFANLAPDELRRTRLAQVAAAIWREEKAWRIMCFRSVADYVEAALRNAADGPIPPIPS